MTPYLNGVDVSLYQPDITSALVGQAFCIVKVTQAGFQDPLAQQHFAACKAAGVLAGGYHWLDPQPTAVEQAQNFLAHAGPAAFLALDVEGRVGPMTPAGRKLAREWIAYVHANDPRKVLLYSSRGTWPGDVGQDAAWVADYDGDPNRTGVSPRVPWSIWQHSGTGIDRNYSTPDALRALAGQVVPPLPGPAPSGEPMTNLFPITAHRVVDLPAKTVLEQTPGGTPYTTLTKPVTLGLLGATATHFQVADGDTGVFVKRDGLTPRTADLNAGK